MDIGLDVSLMQHLNTYFSCTGMKTVSYSPAMSSKDRQQS
jgi:hypothetical protein